jgi:signal transduction histidine kinase
MPARAARARGADRRRSGSTARLERLLRQQESLRAVIESISSELELRPLLTRIVRHACDLIGADNGTIGLVDHERNVVRTEAAYHMPPDEIGAEMPPGVGIAGTVLLAGRPVVLRRYGDLPHPTQRGMLENAVIGMPIVWHGRMIGFFGIGTDGSAAPSRRRKRRFTPDDVDTLALFARHAAVAIENARRYTWEQQRTERLARIARVGQIITSDLRLDDVLQSAADAIHELLGYQNIAIPLVEPQCPDTLVLTTVGGHYKRFVRGQYRIPLSEGIMGAAARERQVVLCNDVENDPRYLPTPGSTEIRAELAVPILIGTRVLGVLNVESDEALTNEDAASLQIIADQLAVAIENARLYATAQHAAVLEERQRLARELHDSVTQLLFSMRLIAQSLGPAWRRDPGEGERRVGRLLELSQEALAEMRALLRELRPSPRPGSEPEPEPGAAEEREGGIARVRRHGLVAALRDHVAAVERDNRAGGPSVALVVPRYAPQPTPCEEALFRIAQEALTNAIKHARARHAEVRLETDGAATRLLVADDGVGFATAGDGPSAGRQDGESGGFGLLTMHERAAQCGGAMRVVSAPGRGTRVEVAVPHRGGAP